MRLEASFGMSLLHSGGHGVLLGHGLPSDEALYEDEAAARQRDRHLVLLVGAVT